MQKSIFVDIAIVGAGGAGLMLIKKVSDLGTSLLDHPGIMPAFSCDIFKI